MTQAAMDNDTMVAVTPEDFTLAARHLGYPPDITRGDILYWDGGVKLAEVEERARDYARHRHQSGRTGAGEAELLNKASAMQIGPSNEGHRIAIYFDDPADAGKLFAIFSDRADIGSSQ